MPIERRRIQAEYRAGKRFLAMFMEKYPLLGRIAYLSKGEVKKIYVKTLFVDSMSQQEILDFAAIVGGLIFQQEGIEVLLTAEDPITASEIRTDEEMKAIQQKISDFVQVLSKLRLFSDQTAQKQKEQYLARLKAYYDTQLQYLLKPNNV
ncbi:MAG: hypothetical protein WAQ98_06855 [Blastocatellia bacterium]